MKKVIAFAAAFVFCTFNLYAQENSLLRRLIDLPAPPPVMKKDLDGKKVRPEEFYKKDNVPPDDAPIEDLIDYWQNAADKSSVSTNKNEVRTASMETSLRLIDVVQEAPYKFNYLLKILPLKDEIFQRVKLLLDSKQSTDDVSDYWRDDVKKWLKINSNLYVDELVSEAQKIKDHKTYSTINYSDELTQLAKVDWEKAAVILEKTEKDKNNPKAAVFSKRLFYENALKEKKSVEIEKYRSELKSIVENKNALGSERSLAFDALTENEEWQGFDDWYLSLFSDDSLLILRIAESTVSAPLISVTDKNPEKWIPILSKLVDSSNQNIRNSAANNLVKIANDKPSREAITPLLPWLTNPEWAKETSSERGDLIEALSKVDMPETIPALIWIVENEERSDAVDVLAFYKDARAVPVLKNLLLKTFDERSRESLSEALFSCNGFSDAELVSFIESYAEAILTPEGFNKIKERDDWDDENPLPIAVSIGKSLSKEISPKDSFVDLLFLQIEKIKKINPAKAKLILGIADKWQSRSAALQMLKRISNNEADLETIINALAKRAEFRQSVLNDLYAMRGKIGLPGAIAACILEDDNDILSAFGSRNSEMLIGTLACARLLRKPLPVREVGVMLDSNDKLLALAAERYLESEDSPEARRIVFSKHPNEALILGARTYFNPANFPIPEDYNSPLRKLLSSVSYAFSFSSDFSELDKSEEKLRREIIENPNLTAIYAHLPNYGEGQRILRIYKSHATFTYIEDKARYIEKNVSKEDLEQFFQVLREINIDEFSSKSVSCHHDCYAREFVALGRNGGRRIFAGSGRFALGSLDWLENLFPSGEFKPHYQLSKKIKGLEILLADEKYQPTALWKNGDDFRVLFADKVKEKEIEDLLARESKADDKNDEMESEEKSARYFQRRTEREFDHYEWRSFSNGKIGEKIDEPLDIPFLQTKFFYPSARELNDNRNFAQTKYGNYEIRAGENKTGGLWKINRVEKIEFKKGDYAKPFVAGNYVAAAKTDSDWKAPNYVVRIDLQSGKETKIRLPPAEDFYPVAIAPAHNKILLYRDAEPDSKKSAEYYLLDAATGKTELVKGEFRPLVEQTFRTLQPTGNSNEFWAAIYDEGKNQTVIGRYDAKNFAIKAVLTVPEISLNSMKIWVDEKAGKVYFIYQPNYFDESHLLSLPLDVETR